ncbi:hypothetical protein [Microbacterium sp. KNMS]
MSRHDGQDPPTPRPSAALQRWEALGLVEHAALDLAAFDHIGVVHTSSTAEEIIADLRGES